MNQTHRVSAVLSTDEFEKLGMLCDSKHVAKGTYLADLVRKSIARIEAKANGKSKSNGKKTANGKAVKNGKNVKSAKAEKRAKSAKSAKSSNGAKAKGKGIAKPRKTRRTEKVIGSAALVN